MLNIKQSIVLGLRRHTDKMSLLHVYTRSEGRLLLQVYGAHSKHKVRAAYQPLSIVELTCSTQPTRQIPTLVSIDPLYLPDNVYTDIRRQTIALFSTEMLLLTLTHPMQDEQMYDFIVDFVHELNDNPAPENLHISFMIRLAELLGIGTPELTDTPFADSIIDNFSSVALSRHARQDILHQLCNYYLTHIESFHMPKSLDILTEVFN